MGYTIAIGETYLASRLEGTAKEHIRVEVKPALVPSPTNKSIICKNKRSWPSYVHWYQFCKFSNLIDLIFNENKCHKKAGYFDITDSFKEAIDNAITQYYMKHPDMISGGSQSYYLSNLIWLQYWTKHALDNCVCPVFVYS